MSQLNTARYKNPDNDPRGPYLLTNLTGPDDRPNFRYAINGVLPPNGRSWRLSSSRFEEFQKDGRIVVAKNGMPRLKRYLSEVRTAPEPEEESVPDATPEIIVRIAMREMANAIARKPEYLRDVEWRDLERLLREVFERLGFRTELTRPAQDGGFDLRLECDGAAGKRAFLIEVKHWLPSGAKPGRRIFSALFDIVVKEGVSTTGLLLSTSGVSKNVMSSRTEIEQRKVRIGDKSKIISLCQHYLQTADGIWLPTTDLSDMLLEGTH